MLRLFSPINGLLLFVALLWGLGFAPQRLAFDGLEALAFNFWRFIFGALCVFIVAYMQPSSRSHLRARSTIRSGMLLGILLFLGAAFQQMSIEHTKLANVAFITGMYVVLVPVIGLFFAKHYPFITWVGGICALSGLALLSGFDGNIYFLGDGLALLGAVFWALQLWAVSVWVGQHNALSLAFYQFLSCALLSLIASFIFEPSVLSSTWSAYFWAVLSGVLVVGLAYTLQVVALKRADPFIAAIIFSFESVFGALVGFYLFDENLSAAGVIGASLMLFGFILAQWHERETRSR